MNRDYYFFREVFLGLREAYLQNKEELEQLKKYVICNDKRVEDFYFWLFQYEHRDVELWICSKEKYEDVLNFFRNLFGIYCIGLDESLVKRNLETSQLELLNHKFKLDLDSRYMEQMNEDIDKIMQSDFVQNMYLKNQKQEEFKNIYLSLSKIIFATRKCYFDYHCPSETISISNYFRTVKITNRYILDILDKKISKDCFNEYHQSVIDKNKDLKEFLVLDEIFGKKSAEIELEEKNGIILCKKKKIK